MRWILTVGLLVGTLFLMAACAEETGTGGGSTPTHETLPTYETLQREDVSFGSVVRVVYRVGVSGPLSEGDLRRIAEEIIDEEKGRNKVNAVGFFFYLPGTDPMGTYTAGKADWAPDGDWSKADTVTTGDYSKHKLVVETKGALSPTSSPTQGAASEGIAEATRKQVFYDLVAEQDRGTGDEEAYDVVAKKYGVDVKTVRQVAVEGATKGWPMPPP